jgi:hypothetical protein
MPHSRDLAEAHADGSPLPVEITRRAPLLIPLLALVLALIFIGIMLLTLR